jgi:hypothetical protein
MNISPELITALAALVTAFTPLFLHYLPTRSKAEEDRKMSKKRKPRK